MTASSRTFTPEKTKLRIPARTKLMRFPLLSKRLCLTPVSSALSDELWRAVDDSRESLAQWLPWVPLNNSPDASFRYALACERDWDDGHAARFYIHPKEDDRIWGVVSLENCASINRSCHLGYWLHPTQRGQGLMREACDRAIQFAFDEMKAHRVVCAAGVENHASRKVIESLGFQFEGVARDAEWVQERWISHAVYARLKSDHQISERVEEE